ncbi:MAG: hypothetical protein AAF685_09585 [Cyanobacteria bacterium P01_C01_bin.89]
MLTSKRKYLPAVTAFGNFLFDLPENNFNIWSTYKVQTASL